MMLSLADAAARLGVAPATLRVQIGRGVLHAVLIGHSYIVEDAEVERYRRDHLGKYGYASPDHPRHAPQATTTPPPAIVDAGHVDAVHAVPQVAEPKAEARADLMAAMDALAEAKRQEVAGRITYDELRAAGVRVLELRNAALVAAGKAPQAISSRRISDIIR